MRHNWYPAFVIEVDCDQCGGQLRTDEVARPESMKDAVAIYNAVGRPEFEKLAAPYRRLGNMDADVQGLERRVITVGSTVEAAVNQLAYMLELDEADAIEYLEDENLEPGGWFCVFRMKRSGTSMKASGVYVPGGVVLHWWK